MRSSSMKSVVITVATIATLTLTTTPAMARQRTQSTEPVASAPQRETLKVAIKRLYRRFITPIVNGVPVIPIPAPVNDTTVSGTAQK